MGSIRADDAVIAFSYSGRTDELNAILPVLCSLGVKIVAITGWPGRARRPRGRNWRTPFAAPLFALATAAF